MLIIPMVYVLYTIRDGVSARLRLKGNATEVPPGNRDGVITKLPSPFSWDISVASK